MIEDARLFGQTAYIFEAGSGAGDRRRAASGSPATWSPSERTILEQIARLGRARAAARRATPGGSSTTSRGTRDREVSHLFRGLVDAVEADALLAEHGHDGLRLVDNGVVQPPLAGARRAAAGARLPPRPGGGLEGRAPSRVTCAPAATRARSASRSATRARTSALRRARRDVLARRQRGRARPDASARHRGRTTTCASPRRAYGAGVYEAVVHDAGRAAALDGRRPAAQPMRPGAQAPAPRPAARSRGRRRQRAGGGTVARTSATQSSSGSSPAIRRRRAPS